MNRFKRQRLIAAALTLVLPALAGANISNTASVAYNDTLGTGNIYAPVNSNTVTVTVGQAPVMTLTKTASTTNAVPGTVVTFTMAYRNNGGNAANVTITDTVPANSTLVAGSAAGTGGTVSGNTITWPIGAVASGASGSVSFQVTVN